jgi:predicted RNA-binding Zn ribbon-like protein
MNSKSAQNWLGFWNFMAEFKYLNESIGGHCAIDLINTQCMVQGALTDRLSDDKAVLAWVEQTFMLKPIIPASTPKGALLSQTIRLRAILNHYLKAQKLPQGEIDYLNQALTQYQSYQQLSLNDDDTFHHQHQVVTNSNKALVGLIADAVGELIANGDMRYIRKCESEDCVLWFYDRTKGHKRRWCRMAACGNRHKVKKFRAK